MLLSTAPTKAGRPPPPLLLHWSEPGHLVPDFHLALGAVTAIGKNQAPRSPCCPGELVLFPLGSLVLCLSLSQDEESGDNDTERRLAIETRQHREEVGLSREDSPKGA